MGYGTLSPYTPSYILYPIPYSYIPIPTNPLTASYACLVLRELLMQLRCKPGWSVDGGAPRNVAAELFDFYTGACTDASYTHTYMRFRVLYP